MQLTEHFTLEALCASSTAIRLGIVNISPGELLPNATRLAEGLEAVMVVLGFPLHHDSGYRCPALNVAVHGAETSQHEKFEAEDFTCPPFGTPEKIVEVLAASPIQFDQLIQEGTWVHISFVPVPRREVLLKTFDKNGKVAYAKWEPTA